MGDWRSGEKIAQSGFGGRFNDKPGTINGGNCYACHQITKKELSYGTLGPSLLNYGKTRDFDPKEARRPMRKSTIRSRSRPVRTCRVLVITAFSANNRSRIL